MKLSVVSVLKSRSSFLKPLQVFGNEIIHVIDHDRTLPSFTEFTCPKVETEVCMSIVAGTFFAKIAL